MSTDYNVCQRCGGNGRESYFRDCDEKCLDCHGTGRRRKNDNLASDIILSVHGLPVLRVSTAVITLDGSWGGTYDQYETWIFSDIKEMRSRQFIHPNYPKPGYCERFHSKLVYRLRRKFAHLLEAA